MNLRLLNKPQLAQILTLAASLLVGLMAFVPLGSDDLYMYLALGRKLLAGGLPSIDPFLYSIPEHHWHVLHEWASYVYYYCSYLLFGFNGIVVANAFLIFGLFSLASFKAIQKGLFLLFPVIVAGGFASSLRFSPKASQFSELFLIVLFQFFLFVPLKNKKIWFTVLPALFLLWVQFHPGFILGLALLFAFLVAQIIEGRFRQGQKVIKFDFKSACLLLCACIAICLINPSGLSGFLYPLKIALDPNWDLYRVTLFEWKPTFAQGAFNVPEVLVLCAVWLIAILFVALGVKEKRLFPLFSLMFFIFLGVNAVRFIPISVLGSLAIICYEIDKWDWFKRICHHRIILSVGCLLVTASLIYLCNFGYDSHLGHKEVGGGMSETFLPENAVDFITRHPFDGQIYHEYDWGSYLAWRWDGHPKIFSHGHIDDPRFLRDEYFALYRSLEEFRNSITRHGIKLFLVRKKILIPGHALSNNNLIDLLNKNKIRILYQDDLAVVLFLDDATTI
jgi:hypothetical protein